MWSRPAVGESLLAVMKGASGWGRSPAHLDALEVENDMPSFLHIKQGAIW
ncbi:Uu.00g134540.m01.CDS01 [Anthostomella pinea]|uniref:Uu.00g134540.m01.CDS01 n=1 Tax=Anthostomella pinea TaxID=933095 RepID=A0AAI8VPP9_9PEZI|nr:Uu.00g134540.m01.CDS01 [Anthostomella pinea]